MKTPKAPAFQLYASDVLSSDAIATMSVDAIGVYFLLLCRDWKHIGLPNDHDKLAKWSKVTPRKFAKLWPVVSSEFELREDGRFYNPRLEQERAKQAEWRAKSAEGGKASGRSRRTKGGSQMVEPNTNTSVCSFQSSSSTPPSPPLPDGNGRGTRGGEPTALREIVPPLSPEAAATGRREFEKIANGEAPKPARIQVLPS